MAQRKPGFTLIELLVVIAIIALLLSIVMPSLRLVKEKARSLSCRANVRSLGVALRLYSEQTNGAMFEYVTGKLWLMQLVDQIGDVDKVRYCPSTKITDQLDQFPSGRWGNSKDTWIRTSHMPEPQQGSYGMNGWLYSGVNPFNGPNSEKKVFENTLAARNTGSVPVFFDSIWMESYPEDIDIVPADFDLSEGGTGSTGAEPNNQMQRLILDRHLGGCNISFLDGHAESIKLERLWSLKWHKQFSLFYGDKLRDDNRMPIYTK